MNPAPNSLLNCLVLPKATAIRRTDLVKTEELNPGSTLPLMIRPAVADLDLVGWARSRREWIQTLLLRHGGLLFRGFCISDMDEFQQFATAISGELLEYKEQTSPRNKLHGNIYTSTEYPPQYQIFLHNENSYSSTWPLKIMFLCLIAPPEGGETPVADVRRVLTRIPEEVRARFARDGWMLVRNFGTGYGLSWQTAFQTDDPSEVNWHCEASGIQFEWLSRDHLRIRQRRPAIACHPATGELVWFNHATFFHASTLAPEMCAGLFAEFAEEDLPYNTYYGDGSAIDPKVVQLLRNTYESETIKFPWQKHDLLLLDNMLAAHGRSAFTGPRKIVVAMTEPYSDKQGLSLFTKSACNKPDW